MLDNLRDRLNQFMRGRYGMDDFSRFTLIAALVFLVLAVFTTRLGAIGGIFDTLGILVLIYTYFRILSKDLSARYEENKKYLNIANDVRRRFSLEKDIMKQRKEFHIYTCPGCKQKIRVPRGKGKIEIRCPKCNTRFIKNAI